MPEGPEIKFSTSKLCGELQNLSILSIKNLPSGRYHNKKIPGIELFQPNSKILEIGCHGKLQWWKLDSKIPTYMLCTYGMSGQWSTSHTKWAVVDVYLDNKISLYFNDVRHFGTLKFVNQINFDKKIKTLGLDPLKGELTKENLIKLLSKKKVKDVPIGDILMNQSIFAGVGNYIRAEALWRAKISPWRQLNSLSDNELNKLLEEVCNVMYESFMSKGATIKTYRTPDGMKGDFYFRVYGKKQDEFGNKVITEETKCKRTIHWCPTYQF